jgi:hypothetical protein
MKLNKLPLKQPRYTPKSRPTEVVLTAELLHVSAKKPEKEKQP